MEMEKSIGNAQNETSVTTILIKMEPEIEVKCEVIELSDGSDDEEPHKKVKKKRSPIKCAECPKIFTKASNFKIHMRTHTGELPIKNFQCNVCAKMFETNCLLKRHLNCHLGKSRERKYTCVDCGKAYTQLAHLRDHELKHHGKGEKRFHCPECESSFYRKGDFDRHYKIHIGEKNFACDQCDKRFIQKCNLDQHQKTHSGDRKFECKICGKRFITNSKLAHHSKSHEKKRVKEMMKGDCGYLLREVDYASSDE